MLRGWYHIPVQALQCEARQTHQMGMGISGNLARRWCPLPARYYVDRAKGPWFKGNSHSRSHKPQGCKNMLETAKNGDALA
jgi:hypothetical protein